MRGWVDEENKSHGHRGRRAAARSEKGSQDGTSAPVNGAVESKKKAGSTEKSGKHSDRRGKRGGTHPMGKQKVSQSWASREAKGVLEKKLSGGELRGSSDKGFR